MCCLRLPRLGPEYCGVERTNVKIDQLIPHSAKAITGLICAVAAIVFLLVFFLTPPPAEFQHVRTERAEVVEVWGSGGPKNYTGKATARVKFENGEVGLASFQTRRVILAGQFVDVDILETDGKKPRYRLTQSPVEP